MATFLLTRFLYYKCFVSQRGGSNMPWAKGLANSECMMLNLPEHLHEKMGMPCHMLKCSTFLVVMMYYLKILKLASSWLKWSEETASSGRAQETSQNRISCCKHTEKSQLLIIMRPFFALIQQPDDGFVNSLFAFVHNYQLDLTCQGSEAWQTSP